jgi:LysR family transcriptional regulator, low CO2-responsive transcriptional regulator
VRLAAFAADARARSAEFFAAVDGHQSEMAIAAGRGAVRWVIPGAIRAAARHGYRVRVLTAARDEAVTALGAGHADISLLPRRERRLAHGERSWRLGKAEPC